MPSQDSSSSPPAPSVILWDLDGTLIDQTHAIVNCFRETVTKLGYERPEREQILKSMGGTMLETMRIFVPEDQLPTAEEHFRALFPKIMFDGMEVLPGAEDALNCFAAIPQIVLTNKHGPTARTVLKHIGFDRFVKGCRGSGDSKYKKPDPQLTYDTLAQYGYSADLSVYAVGDSPTDVELANLAGITSITVTTGAHDEAELREAGPTMIFSSLEHFVNWHKDRNQ